MDTPLRTVVLSSLEALWKKADQWMFIFAVIFNPWIRTSLFNPHNPLLTPAALWGHFTTVYLRIMGSTPAYEVLAAFEQYLN